MKNNFDYSLKYIIIGDSSVGKSNLLLRYVESQFTPEYQLTTGVEFGVKNIDINNNVFRIQIWDIAGQESFRTLARDHYKNSACAIVVYDITNSKSFNNAINWIEDCKKNAPETIFMILVGNKCDLENKRQVSYEKGKDRAERFDLLFFETSAKDGINIDEIFLKSAKEIAKKIDQGFYDLKNDSCGIKKNKRRNQLQNMNNKEDLINKGDNCNKNIYEKEIKELKEKLNKANKINDKLRKEIEELKNQINSYKNIDSNQINNLKNEIINKTNQINQLKLQLQNSNVNNNGNNLVNISDIKTVSFISTEQNLFFAVSCSGNDTFAVAEEKLYKEYPEYRETNNTFLANGIEILRFKTINENKIGTGKPIMLIKPS